MGFEKENIMSEQNPSAEINPEFGACGITLSNGDAQF
tara:strand:+ start:603 stop:713 length:111 start_codon:yes stop_codon:yes gene_type:complete